MSLQSVEFIPALRLNSHELLLFAISPDFVEVAQQAIDEVRGQLVPVQSFELVR